MPEIRAPVDVEAIAVAHLRADAGIIDLGAAELVSTEIPGDRAGAWVKVERLPGSTGATPETAFLERARIQVSVWGDAKTEAFDLTAAAVRAFFRLSDVGLFEDLGVVTGQELEVTPYWAVDPEDDSPRYIFVVAIFVHP